MKKLLPLILSTLLLTSCSGPDSSGGVEFSKTDNAFPYGDCRGSGYQTHSTERTGCGWFTAYEKSYYIMPGMKHFPENLSHANLSGANLRLAYLPNANLTNANLSNAILIGADLNSANLTNANLTNANLIGVGLPNANLTNANLSGANLRLAYLPNANLTNANLSKAILYDAILTGANLSHANLTGVILTLIPQLPSGIKANSSTICPNGINYGTSGNDCPF